RGEKQGDTSYTTPSKIVEVLDSTPPPEQGKIPSEDEVGQHLVPPFFDYLSE
ncbi:hypothetical protein KI387_021517, partial [Taxus chinensis]